MQEVLQHLGVGVCGTEFGKQLGRGLFEFRLRRDLTEILGGPGMQKVALRVFCHAHGKKLIFLLGGYDKGEEASRKRQQAEIELPRKCLAEWKLRHALGRLMC